MYHAQLFVCLFVDKINVGARVKTTFLEPSLFISETGNPFKKVNPHPLNFYFYTK